MCFIRSQVILISLCLAFLCIDLSVRWNAVRGSPGTVVQVVPEVSSAGVGQSFTINITVLDVQNLYGVEATVNWSSSVLKPVSIDVRLGYTDGALCNSSSTSLPSIAENSTVDGQYVVAATSTAPAPPFNGTGNIVRITFEVISSGSSTIGLESLLADYPPPDRDPPYSMPIQHTTIGGSFTTLVPEIPSSAVFLVFAILTALMLPLSKRIARRPVSMSHSR
jgi:hypothetical protein